MSSDPINDALASIIRWVAGAIIALIVIGLVVNAVI